MNLMNRRNFLFIGLFFLFFGQIFCQEQNNFLKDERFEEDTVFPPSHTFHKTIFQVPGQNLPDEAEKVV